MPSLEAEVLRYDSSNFPFNLLLEQSVKIASLYLGKEESPPTEQESQCFVSQNFTPDSNDDVFTYQIGNQLLGLLYISKLLNTPTEIRTFHDSLGQDIEFAASDVREVTAFFSFKRGAGSALMKSAVAQLGNPAAIYGETFSGPTARVRRSLTNYTTFFGPAQITGREKEKTSLHDPLFRAYNQVKYFGSDCPYNYDDNWIGPVERRGIPSTSVNLNDCPKVVCGVLERINLATQAYGMIDPMLTAIAIIGSFRKDSMFFKSEKD